jgi:hypothetical protein
VVGVVVLLLLLLLLLLLVVVGVEVVLVLVELLDVELFDVVLDDVVGVVEQSTVASWLMVAAPCRRLLIRAEATDGGRPSIAPLKFPAAVLAEPHCMESTAARTWSSWELRLMDWSVESRPPPPPQATSNDVASPSPPARSARGA